MLIGPAIGGNVVVWAMRLSPPIRNLNDFPFQETPPMTSDPSPPPSDFNDLGLSEAVLAGLNAVGYESPSPIQAATIPHILAGRDLLGQAQTGTGKTAAFALPLLSRIDLSLQRPQALVLTPTRELAIQVAEAFQRYAAKLKGFHVLPVYGGADYAAQLRHLKRGVHVVVGTPGRIMEHLRKKGLQLGDLRCLVLDEADEMLRMGFIDDVEWILGFIPESSQTALFSATLPVAIRKIAQKHLKDPAEITIKVRQAAAECIRQRYWMVSGFHKLDALTRILEAEAFDGMIIFVRTKNATVQLAEKLLARGYAVAPLSGDIAQKQREYTVERLKTGKLDILVATDVAARGLDVERVSHVINYDIPYDTEAYIHRIGRTGRFGRDGEAIMFVAPRERRLLRSIERATNRSIELMALPSTETINDQRIARFKQRITDTLAVEELGFYYQLVEQYRQEHNIPALEVASALARLVQGDEPFLLSAKSAHKTRKTGERGAMKARPSAGKPSRDRSLPSKWSADRPSRDRRQSPKTPAEWPSRDGPQPVKAGGASAGRSRPDRKGTPPTDVRAAAVTSNRSVDRKRLTEIEGGVDEARTPTDKAPSPKDKARTPTDKAPSLKDKARPPTDKSSAARKAVPDFAAKMKPRADRKPTARAHVEPGMERFRLDVGRAHGVQPGDIVGAIANETGLDGKYIGRIEISDDASVVDLPAGMPRELFRVLKKVRVSGRPLKITPITVERGKRTEGRKDRHSGTAAPKKKTGFRRRAAEKKAENVKGKGKHKRKGKGAARPPERSG